VFACIRAISWAPTDCDTQTEEVEISRTRSFIAMLVRAPRILIDYTGVCRDRDLETIHTRMHPILVVISISITSSNEQGLERKNKNMSCLHTLDNK
jgi:hypothetical protein